MAISLRKFAPIDPQDLITGVFGEWLQIILFCGLFIAIAGAVLPKRLTEKRYGKALVVFTGLILGIGLFMAKNIYNFNFESFGFLAIWLIVILTGFVAYGLMRMGMRGDIALSLTYIVMFLTFFLMTPTLYDSIATSFPLLNGIFFLAFGYMIITLPIKMFGKGKSPKELARDLKDTFLKQPDEPEIDKEIKAEQTEKRNLRGKTIRLTRQELRSVDDIDHNLKEIVGTLQESDSLTEHQKDHIAKALMEIGNTKQDFEKGLQLLRRHIDTYKAGDKAKLNELTQRFKKAEDKIKRKEIQKEWEFENRKIRIFEFIESQSNNIISFIKIFDDLINKAVEMMKINRPKDAIPPIQSAHQRLRTVEHVLKKLKHHEKFVLKLTKKTQKTLKKEKQGK